MSTWRTNRKTKKPFVSTVSDPELHPFVARPSAFEPILTTGQKLTPAQKAHLDAAIAWDYDTLYNHLSVVHGISLPPAHYESGIDPQVAERFDLPKHDIRQSIDDLQRKHMSFHLTDIEERVRTAPKRRLLTEEEYREAGVEKA